MGAQGARTVRAYLECALWSSTDDDGEHLDRQYGVEDFAPEAVARATAEVAAFEDANADDLASVTREQTGHDLWLTRNGHGTGFWDRGHPEDIGKRLTDAAHALGECYAYVGDDGRVYLG